MAKFTYPLPDLSEIENSSASNEHSVLEDYLIGQLRNTHTQKYDLHGRRVGKAKDAIKPGDYVTKRQLTFSLVGTLANRPPANGLRNGTTYFATDRTVTYIAIDNHWYYRDGVQYVTLSPNTKPTLSVLYDIGYLIYATDFGFYFYWTGITWVREGTNKIIQLFDAAPSESYWGICDGSSYTVCTPSGGTTSYTSKNLIGRYLKFASTYATHAAVPPSLSSVTLGSTVVTGTADGIVPDHTHVLLDDLVDSGNALMSEAVFLDGTPWHVVGTVTGSIDVATHSHTLTTLTLSGATTGNNNQSHHHTYFDAVDFSGSSVSGFGVGGVSAYVTLAGNVGNTTDTEDAPHDHDLSGIDFSSFSTDDGGGGSADIDGGTFTDESEDHFHLITGFTNEIRKADTTSGDVSISLTLNAASHTHTVSGGTISDDGEPINVSLVPYVRL